MVMANHHKIVLDFVYESNKAKYLAVSVVLSFIL